MDYSDIREIHEDIISTTISRFKDTFTKKMQG